MDKLLSIIINQLSLLHVFIKRNFSLPNEVDKGLLTYRAFLINWIPDFVEDLPIEVGVPVFIELLEQALHLWLRLFFEESEFVQELKLFSCDLSKVVI